MRGPVMRPKMIQSMRVYSRQSILRMLASPLCRVTSHENIFSLMSLRQFAMPSQRFCSAITRLVDHLFELSMGNVCPRSVNIIKMARRYSFIVVERMIRAVMLSPARRENMKHVRTPSMVSSEYPSRHGSVT